MIKKVITAMSLILFFSLCAIQQPSNAKIDDSTLNKFDPNYIKFYDPSDCVSSGNGNISVCDTTLPAETIEILENAGVKEKAEENMERYKYAEEQTGLAWQVLAALHFREGSMGSDQSILNGEKLYDHINVDGQQVSADAKEDAVNAANHFIDNAKAVYDKDVINDKSMDSLGYGFLAYNRGYMYKCNGDISYRESPYVMNFYDEDHIRMTWIDADSTLCDGSRINDVAGYTNEAVGALAVLAYLCGEESSGASGSSSSSSSSNSSGAVSGDDITWIGDSYSVQADNKGLLSEKFSGVDIGPGSNNTPSSYIQGSKFVSSGDNSNPSCLTILQDIIDSGNLRPYLVFACGTNGGWSDSDITEFQNMLDGEKTKAIVVTSKTPKSDYADSNNKLKEMANSNDNIFLADWTTVYEDGYFDGDSEKIHPVTDPGYEKWIGVIEEALSSAAGDNCTTYEGEYPQYNQCGDPRWSNYSYSTDNICGSGCGAASMAMLATVATGQDIFPNDIADLLGDQYYDRVSIATLDPIVGEHYGFDVEVVNTSGVEDAKTKMRDYLQKGYMIHFTGAGCYPGFIYASGGCTAGHVIGLFDIDSNDMVTQANSGMGEVHQKASLDDMANALIWGVFTAIKGNNSGKNSCGGVCKKSNDSGTIGALTEEQAQKIADYYNSDEVTAENFIGGSIPSTCAKINCVSFSLWFVSAFTDAAEISPTPNLVGDGSYIADTGLPGIGWETGNDPTPFSVFGGAGSSAWSHTGVVVGTTDNGDYLTIEAAYCQWGAQVMTHPASYFAEGVGILAYPGEHLTPNKGYLGNKSLNEIIGN